MTRVLGIDLGASDGGLVVLTQGGQLGAILHWQRTGRMDLATYSDRVEHIIEAFNVEIIATERPFHGGAHPTAGLSQRERQGIVRRLCQQRKLRFVQYVPSQWKKAFCGNGAATKEQVWRMVRSAFGFEAPTEHVADSVGIACVAMSREGGKRA